MKNAQVKKELYTNVWVSVGARAWSQVFDREWGRIQRKMWSYQGWDKIDQIQGHVMKQLYGDDGIG